MSLTGDFDTDSKTLTQLSDKELEVVCRSNKSVKKICDSEEFWSVKIRSRFPEFYLTREDVSNLSIQVKSNSNKELYNYLVKLPSTSIFRVIDRALIRDDSLDKTKHNPENIRENLQKYNDREVRIVCSTDKFFQNTICNEEFWAERAARLFNVRVKPGNMTWKQYYMSDFKSII